MTHTTSPEAWLRGPLPDLAPALMPAAHALVQVREDLATALAGASSDELWTRPGGAASAGFHVRHLAGSLERLLTYARGERLTPAQVAALGREGEPGASAEALLAEATAAVERALDQLRQTHSEQLAETRTVGRQALPATVLGLLAHAAEHASRHTGQLITTLKIVRGLRTPAGR
jgi:uncharacterized damage-inducible protein DinB